MNDHDYDYYKRMKNNQKKLKDLYDFDSNAILNKEGINQPGRVQQPYYTLSKDDIFEGYRKLDDKSSSYQINITKFKTFEFKGDVRDFKKFVLLGKLFPEYNIVLISEFINPDNTYGNPKIKEAIYVLELNCKRVSHQTYFGFSIKSLDTPTPTFQIKVFDIVTYYNHNDNYRYGTKNTLKNSGVDCISDLIKNNFSQVQKDKENNNQEIENMAITNQTMIETTMTNAKAALSEGVQLAVSNQASEVILGLVSDILGVDHPVLKTEEGRALAKIVGSLLVETMASSLLDSSTAKQVYSVCQSAATFNVASLLNGKLDVIRPRLLQLVNVAAIAPISK